MIDKIREDYEKEISELKIVYKAMIEDGFENYQIAATLCNMRRTIGVKYKFMRPKDYREKIFERNKQKYGDKYGPTLYYLKTIKNNTWEQIIESSMRVNPDYEGLKIKMGL